VASQEERDAESRKRLLCKRSEQLVRQEKYEEKHKNVLQIEG